VLVRQFLLSNQPYLVHHIGIAVFRFCSTGSIEGHPCGLSLGLLRTTPDCSTAARRRSRHSGNAQHAFAVASCAAFHAPDVRATLACFFSIESAILRGRAQALAIGPVPTFFHGGAPQGAALPGLSCRA
jgi:hypothetical protein